MRRKATGSSTKHGFQYVSVSGEGVGKICGAGSLGQSLWSGWLTGATEGAGQGGDG